MLNTLFPKQKEEKPIPPLKKNSKGKKLHRKILGRKKKRQLKEIINKSKN